MAALSDVHITTPGTTQQNPDAEGFLFLERREQKDWIKQWFALFIDSEEVHISDNSGQPVTDRMALGEGAKVVVQLDALQHRKDIPTPFHFEVKSNTGKMYSMCSKTSDEKLMWCRFLAENSEGLFAAEPELVTNEGFLWKTNPRGSRWQNRYFTLDSESMELRYSEKANERKAGVISLEGRKYWLRAAPLDYHLLALKKRARLPTAPNLVLQLVGSRRVYNLAAPNVEERDQWVERLGKVIPSLPSVPAEAQALGADGSEVQGYLYKTNPKGGGWARRWFVLDPVHLILFYFENHTSKWDKPKGMISLEPEAAAKALREAELTRSRKGSVGEAAAGGSGLALRHSLSEDSLIALKSAAVVPTRHVFQLDVGGRAFSLSADTREEMRGWCHALALVCNLKPPLFADAKKASRAPPIAAASASTASPAASPAAANDTAAPATAATPAVVAPTAAPAAAAPAVAPAPTTAAPAAAAPAAAATAAAAPAATATAAAATAAAAPAATATAAAATAAAAPAATATAAAATAAAAAAAAPAIAAASPVGGDSGSSEAVAAATIARTLTAVPEGKSEDSTAADVAAAAAAATASGGKERTSIFQKLRGRTRRPSTRQSIMMQEKDSEGLRTIDASVLSQLLLGEPAEDVALEAGGPVADSSSSEEDGAELGIPH